MIKAVWGLLVAFLAGILHKAANATWDDLWMKIFEGVAEAEKKWEAESGKGSIKRQEVIDFILNWITERRSLNFIESWVVKVLVGNVVDAVVKEINEQLGKDWVSKAKEIELSLTGWLPVIE